MDIQQRTQFLDQEILRQRRRRHNNPTVNTFLLSLPQYSSSHVQNPRSTESSLTIFEFLFSFTNVKKISICFKVSDLNGSMKKRFFLEPLIPFGFITFEFITLIFLSNWIPSGNKFLGYQKIAWRSCHPTIHLFIHPSV